MKKNDKIQDVAKNSSLSKEYEIARRNEEEFQKKIAPEKLLRWYAISTIHGKEQEVSERILIRVRGSKFSKLLKDLIVVGSKEQTKKQSKVKFKSKYPGYIYVHMVMDRDLWHLIRNTDGVSGFIGSSGSNKQPIPLSRKECEKILEQKRYFDAKKTSYISNFNVNDLVKIKKGVFKDSQGRVLSKNDTVGKCNVELEFLGKQLSVEINYKDLVKE